MIFRCISKWFLNLVKLIQYERKEKKNNYVTESESYNDNSNSNHRKIWTYFSLPTNVKSPFVSKFWARTAKQTQSLIFRNSNKRGKILTKQLINNEMRPIRPHKPMSMQVTCTWFMISCSIFCFDFETFSIFTHSQRPNIGVS